LHSDVDTTTLKRKKITRYGRPGLVIGFGLVAICLVGLLTSSTPEMAGIWSVALVLVLIFLAVPVALALAIPSILGVYVVSGTASAESLLSSAPFNTVASWTYSV